MKLLPPKPIIFVNHGKGGEAHQAVSRVYSEQSGRARLSARRAGARPSDRAALPPEPFRPLGVSFNAARRLSRQRADPHALPFAQPVCKAQVVLGRLDRRGLGGARHRECVRAQLPRFAALGDRFCDSAARLVVHRHLHERAGVCFGRGRGGSARDRPRAPLPARCSRGAGF